VTDAPGVTSMSGPGLVTVDDVKPHPFGVESLPYRVNEVGAATRGIVIRNGSPGTNEITTRDARRISLKVLVIIEMKVSWTEP